MRERLLAASTLVDKAATIAEEIAQEQEREKNSLTAKEIADERDRLLALPPLIWNTPEIDRVKQRSQLANWLILREIPKDIADAILALFDRKTKSAQSTFEADNGARFRLRIERYSGIDAAVSVEVKFVGFSNW